MLRRFPLQRARSGLCPQAFNQDALLRPTLACTQSPCLATRGRNSLPPSAPAPARSISTFPALRHSDTQHKSIELEKYRHFDPAPALDSAGRIPSAPYDIATLACSAPSYPKGHLIIHPYSQARPQETWPAAIDAICPFFVELSSRTRSQLAGWGLSFSDGDPRATASKPKTYPDWDPQTPKVARPPKDDPTEAEEFFIHIYEGNGKHAVVGPYSVQTLPTDLTPAINRALHAAPVPSARYPKKAEEAHLYVCTHGARDCRCGVVGEELKEKLREEVRRHEVRVLGQGSKKVKVFGVSHIGGHKWAANALVYPHGDWYGNLRLTDSPLLLRSALAPSTSRHDLTDQRERLVHWPRWRGRLGLDEEKMRKVWDEWGGGTVESAVIKPIARRGPVRRSPEQAVPQAQASAANAASEAEAAIKDLAAAPPARSTFALPEDTTFSAPFRKHDGSIVLVDGKIGENLKDVAKRGGIEEIEATCDGKCECATCHAYLAPPSVAPPPAMETDEAALTEVLTSESDLNKVPEESVLPGVSDEESDMLDYAISRRPTSRLTCQVTLTAELAQWFKQGGRIQLSRY